LNCETTTLMRQVLFLLFFLGFFTHTSGQGINFVYTLNKAKKKAKEENKMIFVDVMADWCGPCKRMLADINTNPEVYEFFNKNFVNYQANEKNQRSFLLNHRIRSFPTIMFMTESGEVLFRMEGYRGIRDLIDVANTQQKNWEHFLKSNLTASPGEADSFFEAEFVKNLKTEIRLLPAELQQKKFLDYIRKETPYSTAIFTYFGKNLDYGVFSNYVRKEPEVSTKIAEQLIKSFLNTDNNYLMEEKVKQEAAKLANLTQLEPVQCLAYMLAYREYELLRDIGMAKAVNMQVYGRSLLQKYPETIDYSLLYKIMTYLAVNEEDDALYESLKPVFKELAEERDFFIYNDFLALIYYKTGEKELSRQQLDLAMLKSTNHFEVFTSMIDMHRHRDRYKAE
jgi:thioredoxin-related protein